MAQYVPFTHLTVHGVSMAISFTSPITGSAQTGFTSPTYTLVVDNAPSLYGKQWYVSVLGGTQTGASVHSIGSPFTISTFRPANLQQLPSANPITGVISSFPKNVYKVVTRKGALPAANQPVQNIIIRTEVSVPAGVDTYSPSEIRAALSAHIGGLSQVSTGVGDTSVTGTL